MHYIEYLLTCSLLCVVFIDFWFLLVISCLCAKKVCLLSGKIVHSAFIDGYISDNVAKFFVASLKCNTYIFYFH